jgi:hypothetical protein
VGAVLWQVSHFSQGLCNEKLGAVQVQAQVQGGFSMVLCREFYGCVQAEEAG